MAYASGILIALALGILVKVTLLSPSSTPPAPIEIQKGKLQEVIKLGEGLLKQPEDVAVDKNGLVYSATRDGFIKRLHRNGTWENWRQLDGDGLLRLKQDAVVEALDGTLYYSGASTKYSFHNWQLDFLEDKPRGQLLKYDPSSNATSILLDELGFANGVALSADQDYLVVCESWKYRCLKYWLQGDKRGTAEIFTEDLPGAPDNINLAPDGSFWIALLEMHRGRLGFLYKWILSRCSIADYPRVGMWMSRNVVKKRATVVNVDTDGKIRTGFDDPTGEMMEMVTSALEFEGNLYLGSLLSNFIGKLPLPTPPL